MLYLKKQKNDLVILNYSYSPSGHFPHFHGFISRSRYYMISIGHYSYRRNIMVMPYRKTDKTDEFL